MNVSHDVYVHNFNWSVFVVGRFISTQPQLNIVCSWLWELFAEPWWIVEGAATTGTPTSLTIPEWIIRVEYVLKHVSTSSVTEVVLADEGKTPVNGSCGCIQGQEDRSPPDSTSSKVLAKVQICCRGDCPCVRLTPSTYAASI